MSEGAGSLGVVEVDGVSLWSFSRVIETLPSVTEAVAIRRPALWAAV